MSLRLRYGRFEITTKLIGISKIYSRTFTTRLEWLEILDADAQHIVATIFMIIIKQKLTLHHELLQISRAFRVLLFVDKKTGLQHTSIENKRVHHSTLFTLMSILVRLAAICTAKVTLRCSDVRVNENSIARF